mmetsp:Transcript_2397/g.11681  ORF Transcript_2397/g.11681 Transcript_2397/m.11681 type:complete len:273 (-) Transcript_2397:1152-1970(-)
MLPIGDGTVAGGIVSPSSIATGDKPFRVVTVVETVRVRTAGDGSRAADLGGDGTAVKSSTAVPPSASISSRARCLTTDLLSSSWVSLMTLAIMRANTESGDVFFALPGVAMSAAAFGAICSIVGEGGICEGVGDDICVVTWTTGAGSGEGIGLVVSSCIGATSSSIGIGIGLGSSTTSSSSSSSITGEGAARTFSSSSCSKRGVGTVVNLTGDLGALTADFVATLSATTLADSAAILAIAGDCACMASSLNAGVRPVAAAAAAAGVCRYRSR